MQQAGKQSLFDPMLPGNFFLNWRKQEMGLTHKYKKSPHHLAKIQWDTKRSPPKRNHQRYKVQHTHHSMESTQSDTKYKTSISE